MKIELINPRLVTLGRGFVKQESLENLNQEQAIRGIEKALLTKSIICDEIKIIKEKK